MLFVHGLWLSGAESFLLARRLAPQGFALRVFRYSSLGESMPQVAARAAKYALSLTKSLPGPVHFVGHSLGGLVIYRLFEAGLLDIGRGGSRVVFMGTPSIASRTGKALGSTRIGRFMLGATAASELIEPQARRWTFNAPLGVIAGDSPHGLGRFLARLDGPNDGTVEVAETLMPGATEHRVMPVSHTGMLLSAKVAGEIACFLKTGAFSVPVS